ncbi:collagen, type I, alpha 1b-like [Elgaria multicarinata webbii]|uniref:collagen, type I, alpha 1b-like n=1 Tax=Elgaria multicarinata webbii TaxID=159646 RepID=UPI002FCD54EC
MDVCRCPARELRAAGRSTRLQSTSKRLRLSGPSSMKGAQDADGGEQPAPCGKLPPPQGLVYHSSVGEGAAPSESAVREGPRAPSAQRSSGRGSPNPSARLPVSRRAGVARSTFSLPGRGGRSTDGRSTRKLSAPRFSHVGFPSVLAEGRSTRVRSTSKRLGLSGPSSPKGAKVADDGERPAPCGKPAPTRGSVYRSSVGAGAAPSEFVVREGPRGPVGSVFLGPKLPEPPSARCQGRGYRIPVSHQPVETRSALPRSRRRAGRHGSGLPRRGLGPYSTKGAKVADDGERPVPRGKPVPARGSVYRSSVGVGAAPSESAVREGPRAPSAQRSSGRGYPNPLVRLPVSRRGPVHLLSAETGGPVDRRPVYPEASARGTCRDTIASTSTGGGGRVFWKRLSREGRPTFRASGRGRPIPSSLSVKVPGAPPAQCSSGRAELPEPVGAPPCLSAETEGAVDPEASSRAAGQSTALRSTFTKGTKDADDGEAPVVLAEGWSTRVRSTSKRLSLSGPSSTKGAKVADDGEQPAPCGKPARREGRSTARASGRGRRLPSREGPRAPSAQRSSGRGYLNLSARLPISWRAGGARSTFSRPGRGGGRPKAGLPGSESSGAKVADDGEQPAPCGKPAPTGGSVYRSSVGEGAAPSESAVREGPRGRAGCVLRAEVARTPHAGRPPGRGGGGGPPLSEKARCPGRGYRIPVSHQPGETRSALPRSRRRAGRHGSGLPRRGLGPSSMKGVKVADDGERPAPRGKPAPARGSVYRSSVGVGAAPSESAVREGPRAPSTQRSSGRGYPNPSARLPVSRRGPVHLLSAEMGGPVDRRPVYQEASARGICRDTIALTSMGGGGGVFWKR